MLTIKGCKWLVEGIVGNRMSCRHLKDLQEFICGNQRKKSFKLSESGTGQFFWKGSRNQEGETEFKKKNTTEIIDWGPGKMA